MRASRASGSAVDAWVVLRRRSPWKSTVGLPGSSGSAGGASFRLKLLRLVHASTNVPSTVKCSSESRPRSRAWATTRFEEGARHLPAEQALPVLGEHRGIPHGIVQLKAGLWTEPVTNWPK